MLTRSVELVAEARVREKLQPDFRLSVLVPVYNERASIEEIMRRICAVDLPKDVVVIDDGSTDGTREILTRQIEGRFPDVRVFYHEKNLGKGAAIRTAIGHAVGSVCIIQDADLEYDPTDYFVLVEPIVDGRADVVYGSRFAGGSHSVHLYWHAVGNHVLTTFSNMLTNLNLSDLETCYKVMRTDLLRSLKLRAMRFEIDPELTVKLAKTNARFFEVPISYSGRAYAEGKKIGWRDAIHAIIALVRFRFSD